MDAIGGDGGGEELIHICEKTGHDAAAAPVLFFKTGKSHPPEIAIRCLNGFQSELLFSRRRLYSQDQLTVLPHAAAKYGQCMGQKFLAGFLLEGQNGVLRFFHFPQDRDRYGERMYLSWKIPLFSVDAYGFMEE